MTATKTWYWCSFCDLARPDGQKLVGVAIMSNPHERPEWAPMVELPSIEMAGYEVDPKFGDPPEEWAEKLITDRTRIAELEMAWIGAGCATLAELEAEGFAVP